VKSLECEELSFSAWTTDLGTVHTLQRIAIVAPLSIFYVYIEISDDQSSAKQLYSPSGSRLVIYSSLLPASVEWQSLDVVAKRISLVSVYPSDAQFTPTVMLTACKYDTPISYFNDRPYTVDTHKAGIVSMYENQLSVLFRTFENGIFVFSMADQGDLLIAQIVRGTVHVIFDFGSLTHSIISGGVALNDGEWHELHWVHQFDSVQLLIDGILMNTTTPSGLYRKLDFDSQIHVAGRPPDDMSEGIETSFHGCLARVVLNNVDLLAELPAQQRRKCQMPRPQLMTIGMGGFVEIPFSFLPFSIEFRILPHPSAILMLSDARNESLLRISINQNAIVIGDGSWHSMSLMIWGARLHVDVDGLTVMWLEGNIVRSIAKELAHFHLSAVGCYRSATVAFRSANIFGNVTLDTCLYAYRMCNCDSGEDAIDDGYNPHMQLLPVMNLYLGGTSSTSSLNVSIGPLVCFHRLVFDAVSFLSRDVRLSGSQSFLSSVFDIALHIRFSHPRMTIFTWESANGQRWFQLYVAGGRLIGQVVNGGSVFEIEGTTAINDNEWHSVYWEVNEDGMFLKTDQDSTTVEMPIVLPNTYTWIIGSRTQHGLSGFAGMLRNVYLCGKEIALASLLRKTHGGHVEFIEASERGTCRSGSCANGGRCVEFYDSYACNCSMTPFTGPKCDQDVGMTVPYGSQLSIPWQHPAHVASCFRIAVQSYSSDYSLIRARALFADSQFNLTVNDRGYLEMSVFDGFFFHHKASDKQHRIDENEITDIEFCAGKKTFDLSISLVALLDYKWEADFHSKIRPLHASLIREIFDLAVVLLTNCELIAIIALVAACAILLLILTIVCWIRNRPDGVYKTNENILAYCSPNQCYIKHLRRTNHGVVDACRLGRALPTDS
ncbi:Contactin-associated protein like 5-3, partial [Toxocara canis]